MKKFLAMLLSLLLALSIVPVYASPIAKEGTSRVEGLPSRDEVIKVMKLVNDYWQESNPSHGRAFWDNATYYVGNMEAYFLTGIERYRDFSEKWAIKNQWMGAKSNNKANWKYSYGETDDFVLFGDWQTCFQVYIDLYTLDPSPEKIARAIEVYDYMIETGLEDYIWWEDGLFMILPSMVKVYKVTQDVKYLDAAYKYYQYAKELMYDEEVGLWYRDGSYVYPKKKSPSGGKMFWARGMGWNVAAHAKVLEDLPDDHPSKAEYEEMFQIMMKSLIQYQHKDGYWTRNIIEEANAPGEETSGTAFFAYALAWGINTGRLDPETYLPPLIKAWNYLTKVAIHPNGRVGYVQPIGAEPAPNVLVDYNSTSNFGVGAVLLACAEVAKLVGDMEGDIVQYLKRELVGDVVLKINSPYVMVNNTFKQIDPDNKEVRPLVLDGRTLVPARVIAESFGANVSWDEASKAITITGKDLFKKDINVKMVLGSTEYEVNGEKQALDVPAQAINGRTMVPLRAMVEALNLKLFWYPEHQLIVIGDQAQAFYPDNEKGLLDLLNECMLGGRFPGRPPQEIYKPSSFSEVSVPIKKITVSDVPEPENGPENINDFDYTTRWSSEGEQWLILELENEVTINNVRMAFYNGHVRQTIYDISVSTDGTNWTKVFSGQSSGTSKVLEDNFIKPSKAKFVKVDFKGNTKTNWNILSEIEIIEGTEDKTAGEVVEGTLVSIARPEGTKLTIKSATASAEPEIDHPASKSFDGDYNEESRWSAEGVCNIVYDLGEVKDITGFIVTIWKAPTRDTEYSISISEDGNNFKEVFNGKTNKTQNHTLKLNQTQKARYIKLEGYKNAENLWISVIEFEVYGN